MDKKDTLPKPLRFALSNMRLRLVEGQHEDLVEFWKDRTADGQLLYGYQIRDALRPQISAKRYRALVDTERPFEFNFLTDDELNAVLHDILRTTIPQQKLAAKHGWVKRFSRGVAYDDFLQDFEHIGKDEGSKLAYRLMRYTFDHFRQRWISLDGFAYLDNATQAIVFDEKVNHRKSPKQINRKHGFSYQLINKALGELENKLRL